MDDNQRLQLQSMINENNVIDKTNLIRKIKHSSILRNEVNEMIQLKNVYKNDLSSPDFKDESMSKCKFLFQYYTDIFNKLRKDELNVNMLFEFLDILEKIEKGEMGQHDASFKVGSILKNMYIDSAVKHTEKMENMEAKNNENNSEPKPKPKSKDVSWNYFKKIKRLKLNK
jgi:hypothetical protein